MRFIQESFITYIQRKYNFDKFEIYRLDGFDICYIHHVGEDFYRSVLVDIERISEYFNVNIDEYQIESGTGDFYKFGGYSLRQYWSFDNLMRIKTKWYNVFN